MAFAYYKTATLAESQSGTADSTDWPLAICRDGTVQAADADLKTVGNGGFVQHASGYDIRPYADVGLTTPLAYELAFYDATVGALEMHVKIPTLSSSTDTVIYLAFGDSGISADGSSSGTWNSGFKLVQHLKDGTTLSVADSSQSANSTTNQGATAAAGQIDGAAAFSGSSQYIDDGGGDATDLDIPGAVTISAWMYPTDLVGLYETLVSNYNSGGAVEQYDLIVDITGRLVFGVSNVTFKYWQTGSISENNFWQFATVTHTGNCGDADVVIYYDGSSQVLTPSGSTTTPTTGFGKTSTGRAGDFNGNYFKGRLDEVRISNVVRSPSWVTADYNSQKASSTFISWGSKVAVPAGSVRRRIVQSSQAVQRAATW